VRAWTAATAALNVSRTQPSSAFCIASAARDAALLAFACTRGGVHPWRFAARLIARACRVSSRAARLAQATRKRGAPKRCRSRTREVRPIAEGPAPLVGDGAGIRDADERDSAIAGGREASLSEVAGSCGVVTGVSLANRGVDSGIRRSAVVRSTSRGVDDTSARRRSDGCGDDARENRASVARHASWAPSPRLAECVRVERFRPGRPADALVGCEAVLAATALRRASSLA
jgi:hypothetical protein